MFNLRVSPPPNPPTKMRNSGCSPKLKTHKYPFHKYQVIIGFKKVQLDATICRHLFTAKSLYMFRVSQHPSSGALKSVTATSGIGHNIGTATSFQRGLIRSPDQITFRVSQHPSSGALKSVTSTSGIGHNTGTATSFQRGLISPGRK